MYGYYFCTAIGINQVRFIKKYITMMQITQFMCMMVQSIYDISMSYNSDKPKEHYPFELSVLLFFYMQSMLGLFGHFFLTTYQTKKVNVSKKNI